jgi:predicted site-specific integrase-resolvase
MWITRAEAAAIARVVERTIDRWRDAGLIQAKRVNNGHVRINRASLRKLLEEMDDETDG